MSPDDAILNVIVMVAKELNENLENKIAVDQGANAPLYGRSGVLDSLGLVSFIVAVEQALEEQLGLVVSLADEKAMSQKHSPFRSIGTLVIYVSGLIAEPQGR